MKRLGHRKACGTCQQRHIKCDGKTPTCTPCEENGWTCSAASTKRNFRHDHNPTAHASEAERRRKKVEYSHQSWVAIPESLIFVEYDPTSTSDGDDEDQEVQKITNSETSGADVPDCRESSGTLSQHRISGQQFPLEDFSDPYSGDGVSSTLPLLQHPVAEAVEILVSRSNLPLDDLPGISAVSSSATERLDAYGWPASQPHDQDSALSSDDFTAPYYEDATLDTTLSSAGLWPLRSEDEATLLRYFITDLSHWFDFCDKDRHFATTVVQASTTCQTLLNAIFAVSAKHLSLRGDRDRLASDQYQRRCLQHLIPALNDHCSILNSTLFAATAILRLLDEMTDLDTARPTRGHILSAHILVRAKEETPKSSSLRTASLLVTLRQEIFIAFLTRTPVQPLAAYLPIDRSSAANDDDCAWAVRMIALASDVITWCYGPGGRSVETWMRLRGELEAWERGRRGSFAPVLFEREGWGSFPRVWFANDCHIGAQLYSDVCRILLLVYDLKLPTLGLDRERAAKGAEERVKQCVRRMCGVALSHRESQPAISITGMVIAMCGDRFTERAEQERLLGILKTSEEHLTWPHLKAYEQLCRHWGWQERISNP